MTTPYTYKVKAVHRVVDGDTIDATITVGFGIDATMRFRLYGIDAPEMNTDAGKLARLATYEWLYDAHGDLEHPLLVTTHKGAQTTVGIGDGAFGRWLGDFHRNDEHLADHLRQLGYG